MRSCCSHRARWLALEYWPDSCCVCGSRVDGSWGGQTRLEKICTVGFFDGVLEISDVGDAGEKDAKVSRGEAGIEIRSAVRAAVGGKVARKEIERSVDLFTRLALALALSLIRCRVSLSSGGTGRTEC